MHTSAPTHPYKHQRFPAEIISHGSWLYYRFCLTHRDVEELLSACGILVSYEAIRKRCRKFGQAYANQLRRQRPRPGDKWQLDEVFLTIHGERCYLWRAVDQDDNILDILVERQRDKAVAKMFLPQTPQGIDVCTAGAHHRSTQEPTRRRGESSCLAWNTAYTDT